MTVLPDTSLWVDYLRHGLAGEADLIGELLERGEVATCGPVVAELLAGTAHRQRFELWTMLAALPWSDLDRPRWRQVGEVAGLLREEGASVPLTDIEIAVCAVQAGAALWTRHTDFERVASVLPELERFQPAG